MPAKTHTTRPPGQPCTAGDGSRPREPSPAAGPSVPEMRPKRDGGQRHGCGAAQHRPRPLTTTERGRHGRCGGGERSPPSPPGTPAACAPGAPAERDRDGESGGCGGRRPRPGGVGGAVQGRRRRAQRARGGERRAPAAPPPPRVPGGGGGGWSSATAGRGRPRHERGRGVPTAVVAGTGAGGGGGASGGGGKRRGGRRGGMRRTASALGRRRRRRQGAAPPEGGRAAAPRPPHPHHPWGRCTAARRSTGRQAARAGRGALACGNGGGGGGVDAGCWGPLRFSAHPPPPPPRSHSHPPSPRPLREVARVLTPRGCVSNRACGRGPCRGSGPAVGNLRLASGHVRGARGGAAEQAPTSFHVARAPRRAGGLSRLGSAAACTATTVVLRWGRVGTGLEEKACAYFITYPRRMPWGLAMGFLGEEAQGGWSPPL